MNAKETLQKIADALNITAKEKATEEVVKVKEEATEAVAEDAKVESVEEPVVEAAEEVKETEEVKGEEPKSTEATEKEVATEEVEEVKPSAELAAMQQQIEDLKEILKNALSQPEEPKVQEVPEVKEEPKGLTHSPEKTVSTKANGIGQKGNSIKDRVFKYITNN